MEDGGSETIIFILIVVCCFLGYKYYQTNKQITDLNKQLGVVNSDKGSLTDKVKKLQTQVINLQVNLNNERQARKELDDQANNARLEAWTDYENMGQTLEDLQTSFDMGFNLSY